MSPSKLIFPELTPGLQKIVRHNYLNNLLQKIEEKGGVKAHLSIKNLLSLYELEVVAVGGETVTLTSGDTLQVSPSL